jgi:catechol 2,3-dioxygenase
VIPPGTSIGKVRLRVADIDALSEFYERVVGLRGMERDGDLVRLGPEEGAPLVELLPAPAASPPPSFSTGLFHMAILVPDPAELARSLRRVVEQGWRLTGASDHLVSEALYLRDPDQNGVELYWDKPQAQWPRTPDGQLAMFTRRLDLDSLLQEPA